MPVNPSVISIIYVSLSNPNELIMYTFCYGLKVLYALEFKSKKLILMKFLFPTCGHSGLIHVVLCTWIPKVDF